MQKALDFIEANLLENIDSEAIAAACYSSSFHFQRVFRLVTGFTVGEYVRNRRLSLAGGELICGEAKVIDIALKYGYESPESFTKAFVRFHGVSPSAAYKNNEKVKHFRPISIQITITGGFGISMPEIIKVYTQQVPALRFIGKKYGDPDRVDGMFGKQWGDFISNGWFDDIRKLTDQQLKDMYEDAEACIGLMRWKDGEPFQYWVGLFMPPDTAAPEGYGYVDFAPSTLGVAWLKGVESTVYCHEHECAMKLEEAGHKIAADTDGAYWFFERYVDPRFSTPDAEGNIILDICHYVE